LPVFQLLNAADKSGGVEWMKLKMQSTGELLSFDNDEIVCIQSLGWNSDMVDSIGGYPMESPRLITLYNA
jgi:hypothetical protein